MRIISYKVRKKKKMWVRGVLIVFFFEYLERFNFYFYKKCMFFFLSCVMVINVFIFIFGIGMWVFGE